MPANTRRKQAQDPQKRGPDQEAQANHLGPHGGPPQGHQRPQKQLHRLQLPAQENQQGGQKNATDGLRFEASAEEVAEEAGARAQLRLLLQQERGERGGDPAADPERGCGGGEEVREEGGEGEEAEGRRAEQCAGGAGLVSLQRGIMESPLQLLRTLLRQRQAQPNHHHEAHDR